MSRENVEIVKQAYRALNDGDEEAGLKLAATDIEIEASGLMLDQGTYRGHEGVRAYNESLRKVWGDSLHSHPEEFIEHQDRVVVMSRHGADQRGDDRCSRRPRLDDPSREDRPVRDVWEPRGGPRSRRAVGVGGVARERGGRAVDVRGL
jgi:ketosteroid isomerase-like protein